MQRDTRKPIGVGILGFAHGHVNSYLSRWADEPDLGVRATAGWDHDAGRAEKACAQHGLARCASAGELLERADVQAVVIAAETSLHAELVEQAAAAGKAIVLQKPAALTMAEADRIVAAVRESGAAFSLAWQMRVDEQNLEIRRVVREGLLGRIFQVRRRHGLSTHLWGADFAASWHVRPELNRGMWADDASHAADFLLWLLGEPVSVTAEIDTLLDPRVPDDNGIAVFRYADGMMAEVVCSFTCPAGENTTEIVGERGVLIQNYGDAPSCNVPRPPAAEGLKWCLHEAGQWTVSPLPTPANHGRRIAALAGPLAEFLHGRRGPIATADEGRTALRMILASYRSAELHRRVMLTEI